MCYGYRFVFARSFAPKDLNACMDRKPILYNHCLYTYRNVGGAGIFQLCQEVRNRCYQQIRLLFQARQFAQAVFLLRIRLNERNNGNYYEGHECRCAIRQGGSSLCFNNTIASGFYWYAIACKNISSFMNSSSSKASSSAECTTVAMVTANREETHFLLN